jgi:hypothetical protein
MITVMLTVLLELSNLCDIALPSVLNVIDALQSSIFNTHAYDT